MRDSLYDREEPEGNFNSPNLDQPDESKLIYKTNGQPNKH